MENHSVKDGLGSIVTETLSENTINIPLKESGVDERFGEVGDLDYLMKMYSLDEESIIKAI